MARFLEKRCNFFRASDPSKIAPPTSLLFISGRTSVQPHKNHSFCNNTLWRSSRRSLVRVFIGMARTVNCVPREGCKSLKMELTALLLVALVVTLCAIRSTSLGPSNRYKNKLRRSLENSPVYSDGDDPFFLSPMSMNSGSGELPCNGVATTLFMNALQRLEDVSTRCVTAVDFSNCCQLMFVQVRRSGIYKIAGRLSYCDMVTDGGGWIVILRRMGGKRSFNQKWRKYVRGFGVLDRDFWLGLDAMHQLTSEAATELRVDLRDENGTWFYAHYSTFYVAGAEDDYRLTVEGYDNRSSSYDALRVHSGRKFSTFDNPHDPFGRFCAERQMAGWWYWFCGDTVLTEPYYDNNGVPLGVRWRHRKNFGYSYYFTHVEMKIRPKSWICKSNLKDQFKFGNFDIEELL